MRVWDVSPGYLNRQSLLAEHRELHGLYSILVHGKAGYSRHPETLRWVGCLSGLARRHAHLGQEMRLRGYSDRTPILDRSRRPRWPSTFVTAPSAQYRLLRSKYNGRDHGRIPLPRSSHELWAHHKYSVMARDQVEYRRIGRHVARIGRGMDAGLAEELALLLRQVPRSGPLANALEHMWGHVSRGATADERRAARQSTGELLAVLWDLALRLREPYLMASTALSDLAVFVPAPRLDR